MSALARSTATALSLTLALALVAAAAENKAPTGAFPAITPLEAGPAAALPQIPGASLSVPQIPSLPSAAVAPALPAASVAFPAAVSAPMTPAAPALPAAPSPARADAPFPKTPIAQAVERAHTASVGRPGAEKTADIIQRLAPERAAELSGEQASELAGELIDPRAAAGEGALDVEASGGIQPQGLRLAPWQRNGGGRSRLVPEGSLSAKAAEPKPTRAEQKHYDHLYYENLYFYIVTNIRNKWAPYFGYWKKIQASGTPPPVSQPRKFFSYMRVFGQTGEFYVPGFTPLEDDVVIKESLETFEKFFDAPYIGKRERDAFAGFVMRASVYNKERRAASKFRATVRDNLLKASTMPPEKIAPFFDALPTVDKTAQFQSAEADAILEKFRAMVVEEVAKEPKDAKDRITGVILIGSFALGAATPKSDFDVEPLTADGGSGRVREFAARVQKRWEEMGRQTTNPVSFHYFGYLESRWELRAIHHEPYLIFSPDPALVEKLAMRPGEPPSHVPSRKLTAWGSFLRWAQYAAVMLTSYTVRATKP